MLKGIDVSAFQTIKDWTSLKASGIEFMFIKCTEGLRTLDSEWDNFSIQATILNIPHAPYHFFHPSEDPAAQAAFFIKSLGKSFGSLPAVMDWETTDNEPANHDVEAGLIWLEAVEKATGKAPLVYLSPAFANALKLDSRFLHYPLYVANYGVTQPMVPKPWTMWTFWQYGESTSVPGITDACDEDYFNGPLTQLMKF